MLGNVRVDTALTLYETKFIEIMFKKWALAFMKIVHITRDIYGVIPL
jgi:uncharacterized protein YmfQ (DUF2313 family)